MQNVSKCIQMGCHTNPFLLPWLIFSTVPLPAQHIQPVSNESLKAVFSALHTLLNYSLFTISLIMA